MQNFLVLHQNVNAFATFIIIIIIIIIIIVIIIIIIIIIKMPIKYHVLV